MAKLSLRPVLWLALYGFFYATGHSAAAEDAGMHIQIDLGDYSFTPETITAKPNQSVIIKLVNTDSLTPHNFTLKHVEAGFDIDVDIAAGKTGTVVIMPTLAGRYSFHCNKKLPFLKSHRERGMQGTLVVAP